MLDFIYRMTLERLDFAINMRSCYGHYFITLHLP